jgi:hypothetical protein
MNIAQHPWGLSDIAVTVTTYLRKKGGNPKIVGSFGMEPRKFGLKFLALCTVSEIEGRLPSFSDPFLLSGAADRCHFFAEIFGTPMPNREGTRARCGHPRQP